MIERSEFVVDPVIHRREIARFRAKVVKGPKPRDCDIWTGAIADSGYGRFWVNRPGGPVVISAHRYALALALGVIRAGECARHVTCDNPVCVRARRDEVAPHIVIGTQLDNMLDMARKGRGGRHVLMSVQARAARARALRAAVAGGWDDAAVRAALLETGEPTLFD
ncbi:hypothetical protein I3U70_26915 [Mycobacteroides abscessus subsp. abscessus]|uniref:Uncharacterized protein n=1 Tax=Mycolicibacterium farcinogenes TaxID=1802 RepID=A0ACD1FR52_MYCFR|nr:hypothetical protein [Mycolicibacterium farcinogenes]MBN7315022.1 hypothetical protein [Mycobacteroides abscessus subsp. abscessus]QZH69545.1 hypothetical protein K6L26_31055 [Mycolicibacterium farcinogenes]